MADEEEKSISQQSRIDEESKQSDEESEEEDRRPFYKASELIVSCSCCHKLPDAESCCFENLLNPFVVKHQPRSVER